MKRKITFWLGFLLVLTLPRLFAASTLVYLDNRPGLNALELDNGLWLKAQELDLAPEEKTALYAEPNQDFRRFIEGESYLEINRTAQILNWQLDARPGKIQVYTAGFHPLVLQSYPQPNSALPPLSRLPDPSLELETPEAYQAEIKEIESRIPGLEDKWRKADNELAGLEGSGKIPPMTRSMQASFGQPSDTQNAQTPAHGSQFKKLLQERKAAYRRVCTQFVNLTKEIERMQSRMDSYYNEVRKQELAEQARKAELARLKAENEALQEKLDRQNRYGEYGDNNYNYDNYDYNLLSRLRSLELEADRLRNSSDSGFYSRENYVPPLYNTYYQNNEEMLRRIDELEEEIGSRK